MENRKQNSKSKVVILLFSVLAISGCSSKKIILQPHEDITIDNAQGIYEHIPKPVAYEGKPIALQDREFKQYLSETFSELDRYKQKLNKKGKRYGKNRLRQPQPKKSSSLHKDDPIPRLYPKLDKNKSIKSTDLYGV